MTTNNLIVPINVQALCVGETESQENLVGPSADFSTLPSYGGIEDKAYLSENVTTNVFQTSNKQPEAGIHLHWTLPEALTRGNADEQGNISFPAVPNRWLVTRIKMTSNTQKNLSSKNWIIESDYISTENTENSISIPSYVDDTVDPTTIPCLYLGKIFDANTWVEGQDSKANYLSELTALGYGIPDFAAFYPNCKNIFGFYDDLKDIQDSDWSQTKITYLISGWYSESRNDPLQENENFDPNENTYQWTFTAEQEQIIPQNTLYSGIVQDIVWDPDINFLQTKNDVNLDVAVGNTSVEALSTLLANKCIDKGDPNTVEQLLNVLQFGLLSKLHTVDGPGKVEEACHQNTFGPHSGGTIWTIRNSDNKKSLPIATLSDQLATDLNNLNIAQQQYDTFLEEIKTQRWQIFSDWYRYMLDQYEPDSINSSNPLNSSDLNHMIEAKIFQLDKQIIEAMQTQEKTINTIKDNITNNIEDPLVLQQVPASRYWQANEPVVLLHGENATPINRRGDVNCRDAKGYLKCRLTDQIITSLSINETTVTGTDIQSFTVNTNLPFIAEINSLYQETLLLDNFLNNAIAQNICQKSGEGNDDIDSLIQQITDIQNNLAIGNTEDGCLSSGQTPPVNMEVTKWQKDAPWFPTFIQWKINYYPVNDLDRSDYRPDFISSNYELDTNQIDMSFRGTYSTNFKPYDGSIMLSPHSVINLKQQINDFITHNPNENIDNSLTDLINKLTDAPILAQRFSGFNDALIMRKQAFQLKIADPIYETPNLEKFSNTKVHRAVADQNTLSPSPNNFYNPIRAGYSEIKKLRIIDVFGRIMDIDNPDIIRPITLSQGLTDVDQKNMIYLAPRIVQPSRLLFRFLSARDDLVEMNSHPATSPICGWVVPNHLDQSLMIYNQKGQAIGELALVNNKTDLTWQNAPGSDVPEQEDKIAEINDAFASSNTHLMNFVIGVFNNGADFFKEFLDTINESVTTITPESSQQNQGLSVLIGKPLALTRTSLQLQLQGNPAYNQSWKSLSHEITNYTKNNTISSETNRFTEINFPIRIGDLSKLNDGLIGYFLPQDDNVNYQTFYAPAAGSINNHVIQPESDTITLNSNQTPLILTMLIDPQASIHATSGILPVKSISIPPDQYSPALNAIQVTFLTNPTISPTNQMAVPFPNENGYQWSWVEKNNSGNWNTITPIVKPSQNALFNYSEQKISEGWLKLTKTDPNN